MILLMVFAECRTRLGMQRFWFPAQYLLIERMTYAFGRARRTNRDASWSWCVGKNGDRLRNFEAWLLMMSSSHAVDFFQPLDRIDFVEANFGGCCSATWAYPSCVFSGEASVSSEEGSWSETTAGLENEVRKEQINFHTHKIWCCADR
jgi:hypothetical protein